MILKFGLLVFAGISGGILVSGGMFALLTKVGIITRMIALTKTADRINHYERMIVLGGTLGNLISVFNPALYGGYAVLLLYGVMSGVFTGCLALALAESINAIPVFMRKFHLDTGVSWIVLSFALGKCIGSLLWFLK
ncbi:MAG: stage V sporulation protein AB [Lachnospiraceae bacterium]